jgi:serine/threonine protein kinase
MSNTQLGKGTYSTVIIDNSNSNYVKKVTSGRDYHNTLREVAFLAYLNHPNIIRPIEVNFDEDGSCSIKLKRYECNLHEHLKYYVLCMSDICKITLELFSALVYLHNKGVIHGDIKPKNILLNKNGGIVICDFNISSLVNNGLMTSIIQTCTYRAPEINIKRSRSKYNTKIDVWSVGCIMFELLTGHPLLEYTGDINDEDPTILISKSLGIFVYHKRYERYKNLSALDAPCIRALLLKKIAKYKLSHSPEFIYEYTSIMALCLTTDVKMRGRSEQILYLLLNFYKKIYEDNALTHKIMYNIERFITVESIANKDLHTLKICKELTPNVTYKFNNGTMNYADRLLYSFRKKDYHRSLDTRFIYAILYIAMLICGEPHEEIMDVLEEFYTERQLYNTSVEIYDVLDYNIIDLK